MSVFVVSWDLNKQKANYNAAREALINHLKRYPHIKDPGLDSVWFIESTASASDISNDIRTRLDQDDCLIVSKMNRNEYDGLLSKAVWNWINARV